MDLLPSHLSADSSRRRNLTSLFWVKPNAFREGLRNHSGQCSGASEISAGRVVNDIYSRRKLIYTGLIKKVCCRIKVEEWFRIYSDQSYFLMFAFVMEKQRHSLLKQISLKNEKRNQATVIYESFILFPVFKAGL